MSGRSVVIGFAIAWAAYSLMFTGYAWLRGYDISFREIVAPVNFYQGTWPPPDLPATQVLPSGSAKSAKAPTQ